MNMFKLNILLFFICLFFFSTKYFLLKAETSYLNNQKYFMLSEEDQLKKNQVQETIYKNSFKRVLKGIGFSKNESNAAYASLASVLPIDILKDRGSLILPAHFEKVKTFAVNINKYDSIILKKEKNKFVPFITSVHLASRLISSPDDINANQKNIIRIHDEFSEYSKKVFTKIITFKKGDNLDKKLYELNLENKDLKDIRNLISSSINPKKIKVGTALSAYIKDEKILAISIPLNKSNILFIYKINRGYKSKIINTLDFKSTAARIVENNEYLVTRIDLFKNDNYKVMDNALKKGESIYELLIKYKISAKIINKLLTEVKPYYDLGQIREGKKLEIIFDLNNNLKGISFDIDKITKLQIVSLDNSFKVFFYKKPYKTKNNLTEIIISSNFYNDSENYNLPRSIFF